LEVIIKIKSYHHGNLAHDIVQTAVVLIEKQGIEHLSLRHAAALCGVSATAVYRHFANKEDLLLACATEGEARLARAMRQPTKGLRRELEQIGIGYLKFAYKHPKLFAFMFTADLSRASAAQVAVFLESYQHLRDVVDRGVDDGIFGGSVDMVTAKAWSLVHGLASLVIAGQIPVRNLDEYLKLAQAVFAVTIE
jgi:AcrR family transcriptional regulator